MLRTVAILKRQQVRAAQLSESSRLTKLGFIRPSMWKRESETYSREASLLRETKSIAGETKPRVNNRTKQYTQNNKKFNQL